MIFSATVVAAQISMPRWTQNRHRTFLAAASPCKRNPFSGTTHGTHAPGRIGSPLGGQYGAAGLHRGGLKLQLLHRLTGTPLQRSPSRQRGRSNHPTHLRCAPNGKDGGKCNLNARMEDDGLQQKKICAFLFLFSKKLCQKNHANRNFPPKNYMRKTYHELFG